MAIKPRLGRGFNLRALVRVLAWISLAFGVGQPVQSFAMEVRSAGGPPTLIVQAPEGCIVGGKNHNQLLLGQSAMLDIMVETATEAKGVMLGTSGVLDQIATNVFNSLAAAGPNLTTDPVPSGIETIATRTAYFYRGAATNKDGVRIDVSMWIIAIDNTHKGFIRVAGRRGEPSIKVLEGVARAASLDDLK